MTEGGEERLKWKREELEKQPVLTGPLFYKQTSYKHHYKTYKLNIINLSCQARESFLSCKRREAFIFTTVIVFMFYHKF